MTLFVDLDVPPGALLPPEAAPLDPALIALGALWFDFHPDRTTRDAQGVAALHARTGDGTADAVEANEGHAVLADLGSTHVLMTEARQCAGFALPLREIGTLSIVAVLAGTTGTGRTIAAVEAPDTGRTVFLSEDDGQVVFAERRTETEARAPMPARPEPTLILARLTKDAVAVATGDGSPVITPLDTPWLPAPAHLLIACRRRKPGLWNTFGDLKLADLIFLPGIDIFDAEAADLRAALLHHAEAATP